MSTATLVLRTTTATALLIGGAAHAAEVYGGIGFPGVMLGVAHAPNSSVALRADVASLGSRDVDGIEEGISYRGTGKVSRVGLFADWFPFEGIFRLTGGVTFNRARADLEGQATNGTIDIGGTSYPVTADDRLNVKVEFPKTTPYLGIGWGHQWADSGLSFAFDLGASFGRAKVTGTASGPNLGQVNQTDLDRELAELRDGAAKVRFLPQISFALGYRF